MSLWIFFSRGPQSLSAFFCSSSSAICASVSHRPPTFLKPSFARPHRVSGRVAAPPRNGHSASGFSPCFSHQSPSLHWAAGRRRCLLLHLARTAPSPRPDSRLRPWPSPGGWSRLIAGSRCLRNLEGQESLPDEERCPIMLTPPRSPGGNSRHRTQDRHTTCGNESTT